MSYEITAGYGFILDFSGYNMKFPPQLQELGITHPNRVNICIKLGHYDSDCILYYADLQNNETSFVLTTQTLIPWEHTSKPFIGLESGQSLTAIIGFFDKNGQTTGREIYYPFWGVSVFVQ